MGLNGSSYDCVITYYSSYTTHTTDTNFLPPLQMLQQVDISVTTLSLVHVLCLVYHWFGGRMKMEAVLGVCVFDYKLPVEVFVTE